MNAFNKGEESMLEAHTVRKRVSIVWSYFEKLNRERVRCKLCRHEQNYAGTTGNILRHLRNKHRIDATLKGQLKNGGLGVVQKFIPARNAKKLSSREEEDQYLTEIKSYHHRDSNIAEKLRQERSKNIFPEDQSPKDPYGENGIQFADYMDTNNSVKWKARGNCSVQEERIEAEINYFREKAAYYRMQRNLTALQVKKIKNELDQIG